MPEMEEILRQIKEVSSRTVRIQELADKMNTLPEHTLDSYNAAVLSANLEIVIDHLLTVQKMVSYLSRPIQETSRLWKNGSGQYETTAGYCFRVGSPIEVLVPDNYHLDKLRWDRTCLRYDGRDYYLEGYPDVPLKGLGVRVRVGDQP